MDIAGLRKIISDYASSGTLTLESTTLESDSIAALIETYLAGKVLVINNAVVGGLSNDSFVVTGTGGNLPFTGMPVTATFIVPDQIAEMFLSADGFAGWTLQTSFPVLKNKFFPRLWFTNTPQLHLSSYANPEGINQGLYFSGILDVASVLGDFAWLLGDQQTSELKGAITMQDGLPVMSLLTNLASGMSLGCFDLPYVALELYTDLEALRNPSPLQSTTILRFKTAIEFKTSSGDIQIPLTADFFGQDRITFTAEIGDAIDASLDELSSLLNGVDLGQPDLVPQGFDLGDTLRLKSIAFQIAPRAASQLQLVAITVETAGGSWEIADEISIDSIVVAFRLSDPMGAKHLSTAIFGEMTIGGGVLDVSAAFPDFTVAARLKEDSEINMLELIEHFFGPEGTSELGFEDLQIRILNFSVQPYPLSYELKVEIDSNWYIFIDNVEFAIKGLSFSITKSEGTTVPSGMIQGLFSIEGVNVVITGEYGATFVLTAQIPQLDLTTLLNDFLDGASMPDELPNLQFSNLSLSVAPGTSEFTITGACTSQWDLPFGISGFAVSTVDLYLHRNPNAPPSSTPTTTTSSTAPTSSTSGTTTGTPPTTSTSTAGTTPLANATTPTTGSASTTGSPSTPAASTTSGAISCTLKLTGTAPIEIVDGLVFNSFSFTYSLVNQTSWSLSGSVSAAIFDIGYTLAVGLSETPQARTISFSIANASATPLLSLPGVGSLDVDSFAIRVSKPLQSTQTSAGVSMSASSSYTWSVAAAGAIEIDGAFTLAGSLEIFKNDTSAGFAFRATNATVEIPIPVPEYSIKTYLALEYISLVRTTTAGQSSWGFDAIIDVWFTGLPETFQQILAGKVVGRFKVDGTGAFVSIVRLTNLVEFTVPDMKFGSASVPIGLMAFDASNFMMRIGSTLTLTMDFGLALPESLNTMFGTNEDGKPAARFFNTYQPGNPSSVSRFRVGVDSTAGVTFLLITSPIGGGSISQQAQDAWFDIDFGEFGAIRLKVPVFVFNGFSYTVKGGFRQIPDKPLKVPLAPFKLLLEACGLNATADALPSGIPLTELSLVDDQNRLKFDEFIKTIEDLGGFTIPQDIRDTLRFIEERLDALPDRFKSYLRIELPDGFQFSFTILTDGQARGKVWVEGDKPVKFIYPTMGLLGPRMRGTELYSLMFGQILSGQLLILDIDARIDTFDLVTLALATVLPLNELPIVPDTRKMDNRTIIKHLFMVIIYQTVIPIPVPLFYDELGIEYLGLEGVEFQTHWGFPKPQLDSGEAAKLFSDFKRFFTEHDYLLDARSMPRDLTLQLTIGSNYIGLPKYLSGKTLGTRTPLDPINALENLAHVLNALKTLSLNEIVQALPIDKRVGNEEVAFGPLNFAAAWLMTTPDEFRRVGFEKLNAGPGDVDVFISVLPAASSTSHGSRNEQGLILFLRGSGEIRNVGRLETVFGVAASDSMGFNTGFEMTGVIAGFLRMELGGAVVINPEGSTVITQPDQKKPPQGVSTAVFYLSGHSYLSFLDYRVFTGDIQVIDDRFWFKGKLELFPASSPLVVSGDIEGWLNKSEFYLAGSARTALAGIPLMEAKAVVSNTRVFVSGSWLGQTVSLDVHATEKDLILRGSVIVGLRMQVDLGAVGKMVTTTVVKVADNYRLDLDVTATLSANVSNSGFSGYVDARFKVKNTDMSESFNLTVAPADVAALGEEIKHRILRDPFKYFQIEVDSATSWVQGITAGSIKWVANAYADTGKALRYVYYQSANQGAGLLKNAGRSATEVSYVLKDGYDAGSTQAANILHDVGYGAQEAANAMYSVYHASVQDVSKMMKDVWKTSEKEMKSILKKAGYAGKEVDKVVNKLFDKNTWNPSKW